MITNLKDVLDVFLTAPRLGADKDEPEGMRYIMMSDTLAKEIVKVILREIQEAQK